MLSHSQQRPKFLFVMNTTRLLLDKTLSDSGDVIKSHYGTSRLLPGVRVALQSCRTNDSFA